MRIILPFQDYESSLDKLNLEKLTERRQQLCQKFATKCTETTQTKFMFPKNKTMTNTRKREEFEVQFARTNRLKNSSIPYMQRLLNVNS